MNIFLVHSEADRPAAESLRTFLDHHGLAVELETGENGFRPRRPGDAVIALWSKESPFSPLRLAFEKRALEAWADNLLVFVKLDAHFAPVGLRDLPFIDATFETQREAVAWAEVAKRLNAMRRPQVMPASAPPPEMMAPARAKRGCGWGPWIGLVVIALGAWFGLPLLGRYRGLPPARLEPGPLMLAGAAVAAVLVVLLVLRLGRAKAFAPVKAEPAGKPSGMPAIFVSYARVDAPVVTPICRELEQRGRNLWVDTEDIGAGENWAGEIVRAIKNVRGVAVMCSKAAFESDHVKREVYLADRYKRRLVPVFLDDATPPEDFEYFFAGVQWLKLQEIPAAERGKAVAQVLAGI